MNELLGYNDEYSIVTENTEEALLEGMKKLILDRNLYEFYKEKIKERSSMFDLDKSVEDIQKICE